MTLRDTLLCAMVTAGVFVIVLREFNHAKDDGVLECQLSAFRRGDAAGLVECGTTSAQRAAEAQVRRERLLATREAKVQEEAKTVKMEKADD